GRGAGRCELARWKRELNDKGRSCGRCRLDPHAAAVELQEPPRYRQAQARARVVRARAWNAVEGQEDALLLAGGDPGALIGYEHTDALADHPRAHRHRLAVAVSSRVLEHVRKRPLELRRVALQQGHAAFDGQLEVNVAGAQLLDRLGEDLVD